MSSLRGGSRTARCGPEPGEIRDDAVRDRPPVDDDDIWPELPDDDEDWPPDEDDDDERPTDDGPEDEDEDE